MRALERGTFTTLRGPVHFAAFDHEADVPVYFGKVTMSAEYGQPVLDVDEVVPGSTVRPSQAVVEQSRQ